jgi:hypothetical protein
MLNPRRGRMFIKLFSVCFVVVFMFAPIYAESGEICKNFISGNAKKIDSMFSEIIDELMQNWPLHQRYKEITMPSDEIEFWKDTRDKIMVHCARGDDFGA